MKTTIKHRLLAFCASALYVLSAGHPVLADDTEVLFGLGNQANVLFIIDTSGSMNSSTSSTNGLSKLDVVKNVFADLMRNTAYHGFNVALMRFDNGGSGGYFVSRMQELNLSSQDSIIFDSSTLSGDSNTPLAETFYEAARFWGGLNEDFGAGKNVSGVSTNGNYISPITSQCEKNFTILLTDGEPRGDDEADSRIQALPGYTSGACAFNSDNNISGTSGGSCLDEVADYLYTIDQNTNIAGDQTVETFTIGFSTNQQLLEATAMNGGGTARASGIGNDHYFTASSAADLAAAFTKALGAGAADNGNFSPPALAANAFNGITHFNKLYYALFKPETTPKWTGNVKPYALNDDNQLVGIDGNLAVDGNGLFTDNSRSFWSNNPNGGDVTAGGANSRLPAAAARTLYTYTDGYLDSGAPDTSLSLLNTANAGLSAALLSPNATITATQRDSIINSARNLSLGAPLHSQPALVTYSGTTEANAVMSLFVATNDGFLHALDASPSAEGSSAGGRERFAFIPKELLENLPTLTNDAGAHPYGLDGNISVWVQDVNNDNQIVRGDGDRVYIYVGMRRGGGNYYSLDVTDRDSPVLKWAIKGGPVADGGMPDFTELGQSWSKPTLTSIKYNNGTTTVSKKVLIFGGGYDTRQDLNPLNADPLDPGDTIGRAIFIVDADTGERLWWAGPAGSDLPLSKMTHSIPSDVRLLDSSLDGNTDRLYFGDMRGQIFRIDLQANTSGTGITGSGDVIASLSGASEADNRRFYYPPDVVVTQRRGTPTYVSINIGSGYRAHPLNPLSPDGTAAPRVNDRFYSLHDPYVLGPVPDGFDAAAGLLDFTSTILAPGTTVPNGWYLTLGADNGEKVLAPSITINGEIFFTTYTPPGLVADSDCQPPAGTGRLYRISLFDASPIIPNAGIIDPDNDPPPAPTADDRSEDLGRPGIPSAPTAMFNNKDDGNGGSRVGIDLFVGSESKQLPDAIQMQEIYWKDGS